MTELESRTEVIRCMQRLDRIVIDLEVSIWIDDERGERMLEHIDRKDLRSAVERATQSILDRHRALSGIRAVALD